LGQAETASALPPLIFSSFPRRSRRHSFVEYMNK
jgi:hypothetical protein